MLFFVNIEQTPPTQCFGQFDDEGDWHELMTEALLQVKMQPKEVLFKAGDDSQSGIFIVVEGRVGVYLEENDSDALMHTNTLITGESVGDLDVLDGGSANFQASLMEIESRVDPGQVFDGSSWSCSTRVQGSCLHYDLQGPSGV